LIQALGLDLRFLNGVRDVYQKRGFLEQGGTDIKDAAVMEAALAIYTPIDATSRDYALISMRTRVLDISLAQQYVPPSQKRKFISLIRGTDN
jgi:hypothetical protein